MFIFFSFIVRVIISPSMTLLFIGSMYSFFWMPQIVRSASRGRTSGLSKEYLFGTTACRLYVALCEFPPNLFCSSWGRIESGYAIQTFWLVQRMFWMSSPDVSILPLGITSHCLMFLFSMGIYSICVHVHPSLGGHCSRTIQSNVLPSQAGEYPIISVPSEINN